MPTPDRFFDSPVYAGSRLRFRRRVRPGRGADAAPLWPRTAKDRRKAQGWAIAVLAAVTLSGCVRYHARPLSDAAIAAALRDPAQAALVREAARLQRAPLAPIRLDFRRPLSARELGVIAVLANPDLITLRARERVATAQVFAAGLLPNPVVTADALVPYGSRAAGKTTSYNGGFLWDLSQLFTRPAALRSARASARATHFQVAWQEWAVANQARLLAIRLYWLGRSRAAADGAAQTGQRYARQVQMALRAGALSAADAATAQALVLAAQTTAASYDRQVQRTRLALNALLGLNPADRLRIAPPRPVPRKLPPPAQLWRRAIHERLDLVALRATYAASENRLDFAVLQQYPQIGIGIVAARDNSSVTSAGWQISLTLPLNGNRGAIAVARANRAVLYHAYMARLAHDRSDIFRLRSLFANATAEIGRLEPSERNIARLQVSALEASTRGVLDARRSLLMILSSAQAKEQLNNLRMLQAQSYVGLVVASGARWRGY
ncbi:MAG: TolC family protein [Acidiferrobacterales bacterium]